MLSDKIHPHTQIYTNILYTAEVSIFTSQHLKLYPFPAPVHLLCQRLKEGNLSWSHNQMTTAIDNDPQPTAVSGQISGTKATSIQSSTFWVTVCPSEMSLTLQGKSRRTPPSKTLTSRSSSPISKISCETCLTGSPLEAGRRQQSHSHTADFDFKRPAIWYPGVTG